MSDDARRDRDAAIAAEQLQALAATAEGCAVLREVHEKANVAVSIVAVAEPVVYTVAAVADQLGRTPRTVRRLIASGSLTGYKRNGDWFVLAEDLRAWVTSGRRVAPVTPTARRPAVSRPGGLAALNDQLRRAA